MSQPVALLSVYYKNGIVEFAAELLDLGWKIISSGGTAKALKEAGLLVTDVAEITKMPPILNHRVVTLHPNIHGGILATDTPGHLAELTKYGIEKIDLVCVDVYPVWEALAKTNVTADEVVEKTDIGGPAMLRAAAKNFNRVTVICDPADREVVLKEIRRQGSTLLLTRKKLAAKVFNLTAKYDAAIRKFFYSLADQNVEAMFFDGGQALAYAENRAQNPAAFFTQETDDPLALQKFKIVAGDPSYIAMADADRILEIICLLFETFKACRPVDSLYLAVAGKHGNPCGAGFDWQTPEQAVVNALLGDALAVMGGELIVNFPVTDDLARLIFSAEKFNIGRKNWGLDLIMAPDFSEEAVNLLGKKEKRRLLQNPALLDPQLRTSEYIYRPVRGGMLRQKSPRYVLSPEIIQFWSGAEINLPNLWDDLMLAWATCWRASSNTVALAKNGMLIGLGCGQQDRIACTKLAIERALRSGHPTARSVFASDAFFPYATSEAGKPKEGPELLVEAGCIAGVVTADGKNLTQVKNYFEEHAVDVAFLKPEYRGFANH